MTYDPGTETSVLGIDPGAKGGMVTIHAGSPPGIYKFSGATPHDIANEVRQLAAIVDFVVMEIVNARTGEQPSKAFSQGRNFGIIEGAALVSAERLILVSANDWQRALGAPKTRSVGTAPKRDEFGSHEEHAAALKRHTAAKAKAKRDHKNDLKAMAQRLFPREKVTLDNCDALLLAYYALTIEAPKQRGGAA